MPQGMKGKTMAVLQLWELIMTKIGRLGFHLLISLHSSWVKSGENRPFPEGGPKISVTHVGSDLKDFLAGIKLM